jgi:predicted metal-dependent enzyme (double-stranded beta helix superfamily)
MFDLDTFLADVVAARAQAQPRLAVKEVLDRAVSKPGEVAAALPPDRAELVRLHVSDELTVLKVVWAPGMSIRPHDHRTWASIGIYSGGEDNAFFRRDGHGLAESGGRELRPTDVCLLGDDTIHSVTNPTTRFAGAIHIYGGDFFAIERSEWDAETHVEAPYDVEATLRNFEKANAAR